MTRSYVDVIEAFHRDVDAGVDTYGHALWLLFPLIRAATIQDIYERLHPRAQRFFLGDARSFLRNREEIVRSAPSTGHNPETFTVIIGWMYRQPFEWRQVSVDSPDRTIAGGAVPIFQEVIPLLRDHDVPTAVAAVTPPWRNGLRRFGRALRQGLETVCEVAAAQGTDPALIRKFVVWAETSKLEKTRFEKGE